MSLDCLTITLATFLPSKPPTTKVVLYSPSFLPWYVHEVAWFAYCQTADLLLIFRFLLVLEPESVSTPSATAKTQQDVVPSMEVSLQDSWLWREREPSCWDPCCKKWIWDLKKMSTQSKGFSKAESFTSGQWCRDAVGLPSTVPPQGNSAEVPWLPIHCGSPGLLLLTKRGFVPLSVVRAWPHVLL